MAADASQCARACKPHDSGPQRGPGCLGVDTYNTFFGTANVINSSWGFSPDATGTNPYTIVMDGFCYGNPSTTFVTAAGNSGPGADTVQGMASGYNSISVGALQNDGSNNYTTIASFSSRGPQDYYDPSHGTVSGVPRPWTLLRRDRPDVGLLRRPNRRQRPHSCWLAKWLVGRAQLLTSGLAGTSFSSPIVAGGPRCSIVRASTAGCQPVPAILALSKQF